MKISKIKISAEQEISTQPLGDEEEFFEEKKSFIIADGSRSGGQVHELELSNKSIIELVYEDNITWYGNADTLVEIQLGKEVSNRAGERELEIFPHLQGAGDERGALSKLALKVLNLYTTKRAKLAIKDLAEQFEKKQLNEQSGLYYVDEQFQLHKSTLSISDTPYLLFLHGTASSTLGSFEELKSTEVWNTIQKRYSKQVLAFQHETLTKSPIQNVLDLVEDLPNDCQLDLVSHSRGGLVGDVLSRFCGLDENNRGFSSIEKKLLADEERLTDLEGIEKLEEKIKNKRISIRKFIRVACPAKGTTLASKRLDLFFNVTLNLIGFGTGLASNPVYSILKNLTIATVGSKNDPETLPGLEAMNPSSPFIKILNNPDSGIETDDRLAIIAGNAKVEFALKGLLTIVSKIFFLNRNDLVVDTASMYGGAKRSGEIQYFFAEGQQVNHFHYFSNVGTNEAISRALKTDEKSLIPSFSRLDTAEASGERELEGGQIFTDTVTGKKEIVILLPGIMGSNLFEGNDRLWIDYLGFIRGHLKRLKVEDTNAIEAKSLVKTSYNKLVRHLSHKYDVVTFPFDWRLSLKDLTSLFSQKVEALLAHKQPIKVIGHSMGGVLFRDFTVFETDIWNKLKKSQGFQMLFLGSPLGGSFRIPAVMFAEDAIIRKLAFIDMLHNRKGLLKIFSQMPGLLSLLPLNTDGDNDFSKPQTWKKMREAFGESKWPLPNEDLLKGFASYRDEVNSTMADMDYHNMAYIAGKDDATPSGYDIDHRVNGSKELVFLQTDAGDGSVTWDSGIPDKMIANNNVYYSNITHGMLANEPSAFPGIMEILATGKTNLLSKTRPITSGEAYDHRRSGAIDFDVSPTGVEHTLLGIKARRAESETSSILKISVVYGHLKFASYPLLAGHFENDGVLYAEKTIDRLMNNTLSKRYHLGTYPGEIGTNEVILGGDDFQGAIIVGLGDSGQLTSYQMTLSAEQGAGKYLLMLNEDTAGKNQILHDERIGISSLIIGCGYGGLSIEESTRAIIKGVANANAKINNIFGPDAKTVEVVEFIEQYKARSVACFYSVNKLESDRTFNIEILNNQILEKPGIRIELPIDHSSEWWTRIQVTYIEAENEEDFEGFRYTVSTGGARENQKDIPIHWPMMEGFIKDVSLNNLWSPKLARTLFELIVPNDFKEQLKKQGNIVWVVDSKTAEIPWELLHDGVKHAKPISINGGGIRQLITQSARTKVDMVNNMTALIIGEPELNGFLPKLPGALKEAEQTSKLLKENGYDVGTPLTGRLSHEIIQAVLTANCKILHLAGHGVFNPKSPKKSGMVIGENAFLSSHYINQMPITPEFVFVNCCYLGQSDEEAEAYYHNRYKFAANIGTQLIENGVKAVIVTGWAINDAAALDFADLFYKNMFEGATFGTAVFKARREIFEKYPSTNTWGAYQCYGDPFYQLSIRNNKKKTRYKFIIPQEAEAELRNLNSKADMDSFDVAHLKSKLNAILDAVEVAGLRNAAITELEALINTNLFDYHRAIQAYEKLVDLENASFSVRAMEKYCNIRVKKYVTDYQNGIDAEELKAKMQGVISDLEGLLRLGRTSERLCLVGSAYKRMSLIQTDKNEKIASYMNSANYYRQGYVNVGSNSPIYSLTSWLTTEQILILLKKRNWGDKISEKDDYIIPKQGDAHKMLDELQKTRRSVKKVDYWHLIENANIAITSLFTGVKEVSAQDVIDTYLNAWANTGSSGKKMSEIEHLDFLLDALKIASSRNSKGLLTDLTKIKDELQKAL